MMIMATALLGFMAAPLLTAAPAFAACPAASTSGADVCNNVCSGTTLDVNDSSGCSATSASTGTANSLLKNIINIFSIVVGVVAVIMIIVAGFRYITSGGKQESITGAKNTILYAVIGLIIVALAQIIVRFVLNKATT